MTLFKIEPPVEIKLPSTYCRTDSSYSLACWYDREANELEFVLTDPSASIVERLSAIFKGAVHSVEGACYLTVEVPGTSTPETYAEYIAKAHALF